MESNSTDERMAKTRTLTIVMRDDGIMHAVALPDSPQTLEDARANIECARKLGEGRRVPFLLDIRATGTLSREARIFYAGEQGEQTVSRLAMVADSAFTRVVGNLFMRLVKTNYPVRIFPSTDEALVWLRGVS
jgi:hypothetical protein